MKKVLFVFFLIAVNLSGISRNIEHRIKFSHERGFYFKELKLKLSCKNPDVEIKYTLNGSEPNTGKSFTYSSPIIIKTTTIVKATAFVGIQPVSKTEVHTFIFPENVARQPKDIDGYPNKIYPVDHTGSRYSKFDSEMDPDVTENPMYKDSIIPGLLSIPTIVVGIDPKQFWNFYDGDKAEKTSIEVIYPDKRFKDEQVDCGILSHSHKSLKRSMRVVFKEEYGPKKFDTNLLRVASLNGENATRSIDHLVFRAGYNQSWAWFSTRESDYTRDQWYRDTQILMSGDGVRGVFAHLYINGLYWGLYNIVERPDENFLEEYYGGNDDDWYSVSHTKGTGDKSRFDYLNKELIKKDISIDSNYTEIQKYLDLKNFSDYLILSWYTGMRDWPLNNWWAGINNNPEGKLKYFGWDCEISFNYTGKNTSIPPAFKASVYKEKNLISNLWLSLRRNPEFMIFFADRVNKHCFNDGWLTPKNAQKNWMILNDQIRLAIIAESARWGDATQEKPKTRNNEWINEVNRIKKIMEQQNMALINELRIAYLYPAIDAPEISYVEIDGGKNIRLLNPNKGGTIYYSINGSDPREKGGGINPLAESSDSLLFDIELKTGFCLKARVKHLKTWSALLDIPIIVKNDLSQLIITEIMASPDSLGKITGKNFEFLELKNIGSEPMDISGVKIEGDVRYTFPEASFLDSGQCFVLAEDASWFTYRYGFEPDAIFRGKLKNISGKIMAYSPQNKKLWEATYPNNDKPNKAACGLGYSLIPKPFKPKHWNSGKIKGGTPGKPD